MIVDILYEEFKRLADEKKSRPNPTGSKLGACTASLQQLVFPSITNPEPWQPRGAAVTEFGNAIEDWLSKKIEKRFPGKWGLRGQPFYFPVPIPPEAVKAGVLDVILSRLRRGEDDRQARHIFWGWPVDGFMPPRIFRMRVGEDGRPKGKIRDIDPQKKYRPSVVLDRAPLKAELPEHLQAWEGPVVWLAVYIDGLMPHPETGRMTLIEMKSMSNFAFRRALLGVLEYRYRVQLLAETMATHAEDAIWVLFRKETAHMAEVHFSRHTSGVLIRLRGQNGWTEVLEVTDAKKGTVRPHQVDEALRRMVIDDLKGKLQREPTEAEILTGLERDLPGDYAWEQAETWTPFDDKDLPSVYQRVLDVLTAELGQWKREYGPSFVCEKCAGVGDKLCSGCLGVGTRTCGYCKGSGQSARAKTLKPCSACAPGAEKASGTVGILVCGTCRGVEACDPVKPGRIRCEPCGGKGTLERAKLPAFPCGYSVSPETPVLLADHSWVPAAKVQVGDAVVGVDEIPDGRFHRLQIGRVVRVAPIRASTLRLVTEKGAVVCSPEHPWLVRRSPKWRIHEWREAGAIKSGEFMAWLTAPVAVDVTTEDYLGGYVRGLVDGEGAVARRATGFPHVRVAMADAEALDRLVWGLQYFGLRTSPDPFMSYARRPMQQVVFGGRHHDPGGVVANLLAWPLHTSAAAAGYIAAMFDGEGSLEQKIGTGNLRLHQTMGGTVSASIQQAVKVLGLPLRAERWRKGRGVGAYRLTSPSLTQAIADFLCATRPAVLRKATLAGRPLRKVWTRVISIEPVDEAAETINLTVEGTRTFIAGGLVTHNCPTWAYCWEKAGVELVIENNRPIRYVTRENFEKSGIVFTPPEAPEPGAVVESDESLVEVPA